MSTVDPTQPPHPPEKPLTVEDYTKLQVELAQAEAAIAVLTQQKPPKFQGFRVSVKKVGKAIVAAFASTDAVKTEKSLAVLVATRLLISAGATDGLVKLVQSILHSQGW